eukprot:CAMPEP_0201282232 /NCGR_PEP_ID=MMETSP1317-20130820/5100_1 /ASSEMBLY_ACC=CAM_ASM_000770 /TAXON_ID=187299 /ORGANISM="Undescribed Undescribed, Strain Undescribed" /LENGTH=133 /DNA_ID=CAMNT_0047594291 /DNA_START=99 /DNA_END=500 /DNA_ORIENTATION=-
MNMGMELLGLKSITAGTIIQVTVKQATDIISEVTGLKTITMETIIQAIKPKAILGVTRYKSITMGIIQATVKPRAIKAVGLRLLTVTIICHDTMVIMMCLLQNSEESILLTILIWTRIRHLVPPQQWVLKETT